MHESVTLYIYRMASRVTYQNIYVMSPDDEGILYDITVSGG